VQNAELLAKWLDNARFYISKYRPVPVEEHLVFDNNVYNASSSSSFYKTATQLNLQSQYTQRSSQIKPEPTRSFQPSKHPEFGNSLINAVVSLTNETARAGYGALVFCSSRAGCETDAQLISQVLPRPEELDSDVIDKREDLLSDLRSLSTGIDSILEKTIPVGVAFHREPFF
jgi:replicative superfamily II helicase